jgi:xanthine dehydrogenase molybdenum-binding subunit
VEVFVDPETGEVTIVRVAAAHDIGKAINPSALEGQIEGSIAQGLGYALTEEMLFSENGKVLNPNFRDYLLPTAPDMPSLIPILVETNDPEGPFGAKGIGECGLVPTAPAIVNAICNAIGTELFELPVTPQKILAALAKKEQERKQQ